MNKFEHPLKKACVKVLEDWAMMLVDEVIEPSINLFDKAQNASISSVSLKGPINGSVAIVAQKDFVASLLANVLGEESEGNKPDLEDVYREMGNVLAGNFLTEAYGDEVVFDLLDPNVEEVNFEQLEHFIQRNIIFCFMADEHPLAVSFSIKRE